MRLQEKMLPTIDSLAPFGDKQRIARLKRPYCGLKSDSIFIQTNI